MNGRDKRIKELFEKAKADVRKEISQTKEYGDRFGVCLHIYESAISETLSFLAEPENNTSNKIKKHHEFGKALKDFRLNVLEMGIHKFAEWLGVKASNIANVEQGRKFDDTPTVEEHEQANKIETENSMSDRDEKIKEYVKHKSTCSLETGYMKTEEIRQAFPQPNCAVTISNNKLSCTCGLDALLAEKKNSMNDRDEKIKDRLDNALTHLKEIIQTDNAFIDHKAQVKDDIQQALALLAEPEKPSINEPKPLDDPQALTATYLKGFADGKAKPENPLLNEPIKTAVVAFPPEKHCETCGGSGYYPIANTCTTRYIPDLVCPACKGTGKAQPDDIPVPQQITARCNKLTAPEFTKPTEAEPVCNTCTGYDDCKWPKRADKRGCSGYVKKPVCTDKEKDELLERFIVDSEDKIDREDLKGMVNYLLRENHRHKAELAKAKEEIKDLQFEYNHLRDVSMGTLGEMNEKIEKLEKAVREARDLYDDLSDKEQFEWFDKLLTDILGEDYFKQIIEKKDE